MAICRLRLFAVLMVCALITPFAGLTVLAQGPVKGKIEGERDKALEINSKHNLEVTRYSISKRKAYKGGLDRLQEIIDTQPEFSRMDEVYYWVGEAHLGLRETEKAEAAY